MGKWLAIAAAVLLVLLIVLWRQLDLGESAAAPVVAVEPAPTPTVASTTAVPAATAAAAPSVSAAADTPQPAVATQKIAVESDDFFYKFQEMVPVRLSRQAATCYEGIAQRLHRNQKIVLGFKVSIKDGNVTMKDVTIKNNTLNNPGLENCFIQQVQRATWHDDALPDWEAEDELVIRPERGLKKYMRENIEYVGDEAPRR
ncbi:MAG: hypothetical protein AB7P03_24270 [Kofleriaceae bacterium]